MIEREVLLRFNEARREWDFMDENGDFVQEASGDGELNTTYPCANIKSYFEDLNNTGVTNVYEVIIQKVGERE